MLPYHSKATKYIFILFVLSVLLYGIFETRNLLRGPVIMIQAPEDGLTAESPLVEITGATQNVVEITLDGRVVPLDEDGKFTEKLLLAPGNNIFNFTAKDKFGRERREKIKVLYIKNK